MLRFSAEAPEGAIDHRLPGRTAVGCLASARCWRLTVKKDPILAIDGVVAGA